MTEPKPESLADWWMRTAKEDLERTLPKTEEYSGGSKANDMVAIGRCMAEIGEMGVPEGVSPGQFYTELGCLFYLQGKIARAAEAFRAGRLPSDDCWFDAQIYVTIARRSREVGYWG